MYFSKLHALVATYLYYVHLTLAIPLDLNPVNATTSASNGIIDPFIYRNDRYIFKLAARPTPHRALEQAALARIEDNLVTEVNKNIKAGASIDDPVPRNFLYVKDDRSGAGLHITANSEQQASSPPYTLKWQDAANLEDALDQYLRKWDQVKRSSLVDIWVFDSAQHLLAKGSVERGWPYLDESNSTSAAVETQVTDTPAARVTPFATS